MTLACATCGKPIRMQTSPSGSRWVHVDLVNPDGHKVKPKEDK